MTIKEIVAASGLTQAAFAEKYRIPLRTLENWCTGSRTPPEYIPWMLEQMETGRK